MIKLYKYFFEPESVTPSPHKMGETTRSLNGTAHTNRLGGGYYTFQIELNGLNRKEIGNIIYIINILYPDDGSGLESIEFVDEDGNSYDVIIPLPVEDSVEIEGEGSEYSCSITVEERKGG